jgi:AAA domain
MQSLGMAARQRGTSGAQIPTPFYAELENAGIRFYRSQLCLVVGPGGSGKSLLISNLVAKWQRPTLAFLLDQDQVTAAARFVATEFDEPFVQLKSELDTPRVREQLNRLSFVQADFRAEGLEDIRLQLAAYIERYGLAPEVLVVDNLGNLASGYADEWAILKALTLDLDVLAREHEMLVIAAHHTTDKPSTEPLPRSDILGKLAQYARLILSVGFNSFSGSYKLAPVKNSSGPSDPMATSPIEFSAVPANMQIRSLAAAPVDFAAQRMRDFKLRVTA